MHVFQFFVVILQRDSEEHPLVRLFDMMTQYDTCRHVSELIKLNFIT